MAVFDFTLTGRIEVDADVVGVAVANSFQTQPGPGGEIAVEAGFQFRMDPERAVGMLVQMGFFRIVQEKLTGYKIHKVDGTAELVDD